MDVGVTEQVQDRKLLFADVRRAVVKLGTRVVIEPFIRYWICR